MLKICENNQIPSQSHAVYEILLVDKDCGLAQLSVHADHKKGSLGNHNANGNGNVMQKKSIVVYSKMHVQNVQNYSLSPLNMQICYVLVSLGAQVTSAWATNEI